MTRLVGLSATLLGFLLAAAVSGCSSNPAPLGVPVSTDAGEYREISLQELEPLLADPAYTLVNTHIPFEGDIPGTDLSVPFDQIGASLDQFPDVESNVIVYCKGEGMSTIAAEALVDAGYLNVFKVDGGMIAWAEAGNSLER